MSEGSVFSRLFRHLNLGGKVDVIYVILDFGPRLIWASNSSSVKDFHSQYFMSN